MLTPVVTGKTTAKAPSSKAVAQSRGEKRKPQSCDVPEADEFTASGRRKRKDTGAKREGAAKGWTEEEERLFLEGLELYGREWHKAAAHVGEHSVHTLPAKSASPANLNVRHP